MKMDPHTPPFARVSFENLVLLDETVHHSQQALPRHESFEVLSQSSRC